ncbi:MAG: hypothetical protein H6729_08580 [Deltaproteobacteria bacterium]|nr:hypothetical protein [Deltaproteobacteria bacterium]
MTSEMLEVRLTAEGSHQVGQPINIRMVVSNPTTEPLTFCKYHTPFEGLRNDIFAVRSAGHELEYRGAMAKRSAPEPQDYIQVAPGASVEAVIDLSGDYAFEAGVYEIVYRSTIVSGLKASPPLTLTVAP